GRAHQPRDRRPPRLRPRYGRTAAAADPRHLGGGAGPMSDDTTTDDSVPLAVQRRVEAACRRFEAAWQSGERPRLEDYLAETAGPEQAALLVELLRLDVHYRTRA